MGCWKTFSTPLLYLSLKEREFAAKEKLEIVNVLGFALYFAPPAHPESRLRGNGGRGQNSAVPVCSFSERGFELFLEYSVS